MRTVCFFLFFLFIFCANVFAQSVGQLSSNSKYTKIIEEIKSVSASMNSMKNNLAVLKDSVANYPSKRNTLLNPIMSLEGIVFEAENKLASLRAQETFIIQEFTLDQAQKIDTVARGVSVSTSLLDNNYIKDNLSTQESEILYQERVMDKRYQMAVSQIDSIYVEAKKIDDILRNTSTEFNEADSVKLIALELLEKARTIESEFVADWNNIFDTKLYVYSRIMQNFDEPVELLNRLNNDRRNISASLDEKYSNVFCGGIYHYNGQKKLSNEYERIVAFRLAAISVLDSLDEIDASDKLNIELKPEIILPDYIYPTFENLTIEKKQWFSGSSEDLTFFAIPTVGAVYSNRLVSLLKELPKDTKIRRLRPLYKVVNSGDYVEYYAGVYATIEDAKNDIIRLNKLGYKPITVKFEKGGKVMRGGMVYPIDANDFLYIIEFDSMDSKLREAIAKAVPDKQITRLDDNKFTLGVFDKYMEIMDVYGAIGTVGKIIKVKK